MKKGGPVKSPSCMGKYGLPPGVKGGSKPSKKGSVVSPSMQGSMGKPHSKGFPGTGPARD